MSELRGRVIPMNTIVAKPMLYVLDREKIKTIEDVITLLMEMGISIPVERFEKAPKESKKYFKLVEVQTKLNN